MVHLVSQDLSVTGKRAGLKHSELGDEETTRSGLFMEQIRIIKEMREEDKKNGRTDEFCRPRFAIWENVYGATSSNAGKDYAAVVEEFIKVVEPNIPSVQVPEKGWSKSGCFYDELGRWSIAWRLFDAQYFGVSYHSDDGSIKKYGTPQRRKRICLVADFNGLAAPEILFERKGLCWNSEESEEERKAFAENFGRSTRGTEKSGDSFDSKEEDEE